jgi:hypothetical protein
VPPQSDRARPFGLVRGLHRLRNMQTERPLTIAVLDTNDDVVELLRILFEQRGCAVVTAHADAIKRSQMDGGKA